MYCERRDHMEIKGIDPTKYCKDCTTDPLTGDCVALTELKIIVKHLSGCCMKGFPAIVETP